ncbi:MAG: glycosyl transferase, partial [Elusimicrobia bacterium]|nr:glycosyl transferase [Elusimicrobiota bacterium]
LYPPGSLSADVLDQGTFRALCPKADDLWLYWMGRKAGAVYKKTADRSNIAENIRSNQDVALWYDNVIGGLNDKYVARLIEKFGWPG